jgi:hypothetical protein
VPHSTVLASLAAVSFSPAVRNGITAVCPGFPLPFDGCFALRACFGFWTSICRDRRTARKLPKTAESLKPSPRSAVMRSSRYVLNNLKAGGQARVKIQCRFSSCDLPAVCQLSRTSFLARTCLLASLIGLACDLLIKSSTSNSPWTQRMQGYKSDLPSKRETLRAESKERIKTDVLQLKTRIFVLPRPNLHARGKARGS